MNPPKSQTTAKRKPTESPPKRDPLNLCHLIIQCRNETQQRALYERLSREGLRCRVVIL